MKKRQSLKNILFFLGFFLLTSCANDKEKTITVTAKSNLEVTEVESYFVSFSLEKTNIDPAKAYLELDKEYNQIYQSFLEQKDVLAFKKITTGKIELRKNRSLDKNYIAKRDLNIHLFDLEKLNLVIDLAIKNNVQEIKPIKYNFQLKDQDKLNLLKKALLISKEKAQILAQNSNQEIDKIIKIKEINANPRSYSLNSRAPIIADSKIFSTELEVIFKTK